MPRLGTSIPLLGREPELGTLRTALRRAGSGQAGAVLLAGDAGVGKSRLLTELVTEAERDGVTVLSGRCLDVGEAGLPYLPFVEALGRLGAEQRELAAQWPVLGLLLPALASPEQAGQAMERLRLFDAVHGLLSELAARHPVLLALEDLHWADVSTRDLVLFLLSRLDTQNLLVVATYRTDDLHRRHPLRPLLAEVSRLPAVGRIELGPFSAAEAVAFVSALAEGALPDTTLHAVAERSEGNAFFCEELTAAAQRGASLPGGLLELLLARVERLSPETRRVVRAVSGAAQLSEHACLREVCGLDDTALETALREAVLHNVLVPAEDGYAFRHALLREAVYDDLLPGERVRLHAGFARVAGRIGTPAALAYHSFRSHDLPTALAASVRAADEATRMHAPGEALQHLEQALQLWDAVPGPEGVAGRDELALLWSASGMAFAAGEIDRAVTYARSAVTRADLRNDPELAADARHQLATALIPFDTRRAEVSQAVGEAWDLVRDRPASVVRAKVLALRARAWVWGVPDLDVDELSGHVEQAIADARAAGAPDVEADGLVTLAAFESWRERTARSIELGTAAAERAAAIGATRVELRALHNITSNLLISRDVRGAARMSAQVWQRAERAGLGWSDVGVEGRTSELFDLYVLGDWDDALARAEVTGAPRFARARIGAYSAPILVAQGRFAEVEDLAARLADQRDDARTDVVFGIALAEAAQWRGDPLAAVAGARSVLDRIRAMSRSSVADIRWAAATGVSALADLAEQARRRGEDTGELAGAGEELAATEPASLLHVRLEARSPDTLAPTARLTADLNRLRGQDDPDAWAHAVKEAEALPYWQLLARWRWAAALLAHGDRDAAAEQIRLVHTAATELGARPLRSAVDDLARRGRLTVAGGSAPEDDVLTPRERSVLELVAGGLTNRQVGERLFISEKTASVHLSRVMAKLGAGSRAEAVSRAHQRGLLG
ncbi:helix-turn-helix transcriptional regulator [Amycolatopsis thermophila]|uniref:DNA-binding NarL/FixJ family response regulator n=1 Tax=Amycolatopsis thermophila TaxID=206084 RepID=A0ABU0EXA7_9PSEU|nr:helix-turn-helix transcriptional regulator [Amycolatopsis thermophila]MDQ0379748.1 DNA-binding NarL/FixJ family response regulator [Amycolatopsis thermophila]